MKLNSTQNVVANGPSILVHLRLKISGSGVFIWGYGRLPVGQAMATNMRYLSGSNYIMNEIERTVKHTRMWREFYGENIPNCYSEWCCRVGLCETAGWIDENERAMLDWVIPGYKYTGVKKITEIEYNAKRAKRFHPSKHEHSFRDNNFDTVEWCVYVGLWETASWIPKTWLQNRRWIPKNWLRGKRKLLAPDFRWLDPKQRD